MSIKSNKNHTTEKLFSTEQETEHCPCGGGMSETQYAMICDEQKYWRSQYEKSVQNTKIILQDCEKLEKIHKEKIQAFKEECEKELREEEQKIKQEYEKILHKEEQKLKQKYAKELAKLFINP